MIKNAPLSPILRQIFRLNQIAGTKENAFRIPPKYKKVELVMMSKQAYGPSIGLKHFWRNHLPTLKFHNDDVQFFTTKVKVSTKEEIAQAPSKIVIHDETGNKTEIDCMGDHHLEILKKFVAATASQPIDETEIPKVAPPRATR